MALLEPTAGADFAYGWQTKAPADVDDATIDEAWAAGDPLSPAKGMALAAVLGSAIWAVILWGLL